MWKTEWPPQRAHFFELWFIKEPGEQTIKPYAPDESVVTVFDSGSYRDRSSRVYRSHGSVFRALDGESWEQWKFVSSKPFLQRAMQNGQVVETSEDEAARSELPSDTKWVGVLRHETIPFISYGYEWSFSMLKDAALLHLDLLLEGLSEGVILKDATPFNTQFRGAQCTFIDIPSFVKHRSGGLWPGYRQFCQMFLYPLMLQAYRGIDLQPLLRGRLNGFTPQEFLRFLSFRDLFRRGVFSHGYLHARLENMFGEKTDGIPETMEKSGFQAELIQANVSRLRKIISGLQWKPQTSLWSEYDSAPSPAQVDGAAKEAFVAEAVSTRQWQLTWDLGCNVGRYSRIAATNSSAVVAMDVDHLAIERLYLSLKDEGNRKITPLVSNLADPSPAMGWRCRERQDLPSRGRPDLVLCLALIHHLVMRENVLLHDLIDWLAELGGALVIEYVDKADPQVKTLLANREDQYDDYSSEIFERQLSARFQILRSQKLPSGTRTIYFATPTS